MAKTKRTKREEAEIRQGLYEAMTPKQRLAKLDKGGFRAVKERARLKALISEGV